MLDKYKNICAEVRDLIDGKVVNASTALTRHVTTHQLANRFQLNNSEMRMNAWPLLGLLFYMRLKNGESDLLVISKDLLILFVIVSIAYFSVVNIKLRMRLEIPVISSIGRACFLTASESKQYDMQRNLDKLKLQVPPCYTGISRLMYLGLEGLKAGALDCLGVAGLTLLKLRD